MKTLASSHFIFLTTILLACSWCDVVSPLHEKHYQPNSADDLGNPVMLDYEEIPPLSAKTLIKREDAGELESDHEEIVSPSPLPPDDQNITEGPTASEAPSTTTTVTSSTSSTPPSTTTEPPSTTTEPPFTLPGEGEATKGYFCLCDLHVRSCDMNCCCDTDCSAEEKTLFTGCTGSVIYDPKNHQNKDHSCMKSYIMYRQNSPYRIDRTDKSLFCIVKENVKQGREFSQRDMARIKKRISHGKLDSKPKYGWGHSAQEFKITISPKPYKYGSPIWTLKLMEGEDAENSQERILRLPSSYHTDTCSLHEPVKFLDSSMSSCILPIVPLDTQCESLRALNANHFIKNYSVILNPARTVDNSTDYIAQDVIPAVVCRNDWKHCKNIAQGSIANGGSDIEQDDIELPTPVLNADKDACLNVLSHLSLTFVHNGTEGISHIIAKMVLADIPLNAKHIRQQFAVDFIWGSNPKTGSPSTVVGVSRNDTNQTTSVEDILALQKLPRSGNPGYIVGKAIILGRKVQRTNAANGSTSGSKKIEHIHVLPDSSQWLHIHQAGNCPTEGEDIKDFSKYPVLFGYEHVSSCRLPLEPFRNCEELQRHITSILLGITDQDPESIIKSPPFVAAYGSPDAFPSDWVPLTFVDKSSFLVGSSSSPFPQSLPFPSNNLVSGGCSITTSVHVTIAFAYVGPVDSPQAKITGVFYEPEESVQIPPTDTSDEEDRNVRDIAVTTTVSFVDVSGKPTTRVATWPVLSIQLPSDFFYPFSSSSAATPSGGESMRKNDVVFSFIIMFAGIFLLV